MADDSIRQTIRFSEHSTRILRGRASSMWPEFEGNVNGLNNKIIADWDRMREELGGGGRTARIERLEKRLALVEERLGMADYDTDHG